MTTYIDKYDVDKVIPLTEREENGSWKLPPRKDDEYYWSGNEGIPEIGERVKVKVNDIGEGIVVGYFVECGYLGVKVELDEETRAEWHKRQNPDINYALPFGIEIKRWPHTS